MDFFSNLTCSKKHSSHLLPFRKFLISNRCNYRGFYLEYELNSFRLDQCGKPDIHDSVFVANTASIIGQVTLAENCGIWFGAVLRSDMAPISIGKNCNIQDNAVVHVDFGFPTLIEDNVSVGHSAIIHGATVRKNCIIGMHSTLLNGAEIGENCIIGAGAIVMQGQVIPPNSIVMGVPAKVKKQADEQTLIAIRRNWEIYCDFAKEYRKSKYHRRKESL
ncbi:gamma carbonic anhydrase family protein [bacterium]|nr:gamma carbonic anhydrase family protein [bacterium]